MFNSSFLDLPKEYLFPEIHRRVTLFQERNPSASLLRLGIGDVTLPLAHSIVAALHSAVEEMATAEGFHGYGPEQGYLFLRERIAEEEYSGLGIDADELFISDGSKGDCANLQELFDPKAIVGVADPTYPVYVDANVLAGRGGKRQENSYYSNICYFPCYAENNFIPIPPQQHCDVIYLCSPNNPTGQAMDAPQLQRWVDYALEHKAVIIYDAAYAAFIRSPNAVRSIYQIADATKVAIELRSFSKSAGFTGLRCAYSVVPKQLTLACQGQRVPLHALWKRRQTTKFNGVAYPIQRAAAAVYTPEGKEETKAQVDLYVRNAQLLKQALQQMQWNCYGGTDAPFIWWEVPCPLDSWQFFDLLLSKLHIVATPGAGFGPQGNRFMRLSAFAKPDAIATAIERLHTLPQWL